MCFNESRTSSMEKDDQAYVRNSSFLSRDIEAQKSKDSFVTKTNSSPKKNVISSNIDTNKDKNNTHNASPPRNSISPPKKAIYDFQPKKDIIGSPPMKENCFSPLSNMASPPRKENSPPIIKNIFLSSNEVDSSSSKNNIITLSTNKKVCSSRSDTLTSFTKGIPSNLKLNVNESKDEEDSRKIKKDITTKEVLKTDKLSLPTANENVDKKEPNTTSTDTKNDKSESVGKNEENNGVGDKIRKFEKAAEDASASVGRLSRANSVRNRSRTERLGSDSKDDLPSPATPFKDNIFFDTGNGEKINTNHKNSPLERQQSIKGSNVAAKWQRNESSSIEDKIQKPEPQKIIKPEFKPMQSPVDLTIRSPSLGAKIPDQFPSQGTAFRNVSSPDAARLNSNKTIEDIKAYKLKNKQKLCVSKGTSYFSRVSDEVWLVKKNAIEEIEDRVLDSFRRAGGNPCVRSETMRASSDSGHGAPFTHATMGRNKRQMYARSESLDPQWANARSQTLKRQSSVACTCGHDKKTKAKSVDTTPRPRSRSHGDENNQNNVLDKYETLV